MFDVVCVGNRTVDIIVKSDRTIQAKGGSATYCSLCLKKLKAKTAVVTSGLNALFELYYKNNTRLLKILKPGGKIEAIQKRYLNTKSILFCPVYNEIKPALIKEFKGLKALDIQGIVRTKKGIYVCNKVPSDFFEYLDTDIVSMSMHEALAVSEHIGVTTKDMCIKICMRKAKIVIITMGEKGSLVYDNNLKKFYRIPAYKTVSVDETGAGDVYLAAFLYCYMNTKSTIVSAYFASAAASFVIEDVGPKRFGGESEILKRMQQLHA